MQINKIGYWAMARLAQRKGEHAGFSKLLKKQLKFVGWPWAGHYLLV